MSLPGAFSDCTRFWSKWIIVNMFLLSKENISYYRIYLKLCLRIGVQLNGVYNSTRTQKKVKVDSDTQLHISNAIVDFGCLSHQGIYN